MNESLKVDLGERSYPIHFSSDLEQIQLLFNKLSSRSVPYAVFIDENVCRLQDTIGWNCPTLVLPSGESTKSVEWFGKCCEFLAENRIPREGTLIAIGGGVTGDLTGFVAASYLRGIKLIQIPTTLLSMVDSSVGGKTGINLQAGKNLVGAFWQPEAVHISTKFLETLPSHEFAAGMAEVIKYGMLFEMDLFDQIEQIGEAVRWDTPNLNSIMNRCCSIKAEIVKSDEKETANSGGRALLNLGHTFAHAIEKVAGYGSYLHGEAVAIGLHLATKLSIMLTESGLGSIKFRKEDVARVEALLKLNHLPTDLKSPLYRDGEPKEPKPIALESLIQAMYRDKKVRGGKIRFVAMESLGWAVTVNFVSEDLVREIWLEAGATV